MLDFRPLTQRNQCKNEVPNLQFRHKLSMQSFVPLTERSTLSKNHHHSLLLTTRNSDDLFMDDPNAKVNELIPGVKFGTFFGSIQQATQRLVRSKIVQEKGSNSVDELQIARETIKGINKGKEPSQFQKELMKKIEQMQQKLKKYEQINPKIRKQNKQLQQRNRKMRNQSILYQNQLFRWQKQLKLKNQELKQKDYAQKEFQIRLQKIFNKPVHHNDREIKIIRLK